MMKKIYQIFFPSLFVFLTSLACSLPFSAPERSATAFPTTEATAPPVTSTPPPATPTPVETPAIIDPCLLGLWTMDVVALNNKYLDLVPTGNMFVTAPSSMAIDFRADNTFNMSGETTIRFDIPNTSDYLQGYAYHEGQGSYAADGTLLTTVAVNYTVDNGAMTSYINGVTTVSETPPPSPGIPMAPPSSASYLCRGNLLQISYDSPSGPVTEEWSR